MSHLNDLWKQLMAQRALLIWTFKHLNKICAQRPIDCLKWIIWLILNTLRNLWGILLMDGYTVKSLFNAIFLLSWAVYLWSTSKGISNFHRSRPGFNPCRRQKVLVFKKDGSDIDHEFWCLKWRISYKCGDLFTFSLNNSSAPNFSQ